VANLLALVPAASAATVSTVSATVDAAKTTELNPTLLADILKALPDADRKAFAAAVVDAIKNEPVGAATFAQYQAQFTQVAATGVVPVFPPPIAVS